MRRTRSIPPKTNFLVSSAGLLAAKLVQSWMSTLDYRVGFYDRSVDPALGLGGPRIYIFWHENIHGRMGLGKIRGGAVVGWRIAIAHGSGREVKRFHVPRFTPRKTPIPSRPHTRSRRYGEQENGLVWQVEEPTRFDDSVIKSDTTNFPS